MPAKRLEEVPYQEIVSFLDLLNESGLRSTDLFHFKVMIPKGDPLRRAAVEAFLLALDAGSHAPDETRSYPFAFGLESWGRTPLQLSDRDLVAASVAPWREHIATASDPFADIESTPLSVSHILFFLPSIKAENAREKGSSFLTLAKYLVRPEQQRFLERIVQKRGADLSVETGWHMVAFEPISAVDEDDLPGQYKLASLSTTIFACLMKRRLSRFYDFDRRMSDLVVRGEEDTVLSGFREEDALVILDGSGMSPNEEEIYVAVERKRPPQW